MFTQSIRMSIIRYLRPLALVLLVTCAIPVGLTFGQKPSKQSQVKTDPELQQRRATAMSLLQSLAIEARSYRDEALRARVQARIADVIWTQDQEAARALFQRAWEAAEAVDQSSANSNLPGRRSNTGRTQPRMNLRREILGLASRRDYKLAEEFIAKLTPKEPNESASNHPASPAESTERLRLAGQFLDAGEVERALQFADPALRTVSERTILFLVQLRAKNAAAADQRFAYLLAFASADPDSDANTVSLLTSFAFTPSVYLVVSRTGIPSSNSYEPRLPPVLAPALRRRFFEVSASILLRPLTHIDRSSAGRPGTQLIVKRLIPLFDQFAADLAAPLKAQLAAMGAEPTRTYAVRDIELNPSTDGERDRTAIDEELKGLDRATSPDDRDRVYAFAALHAADLADPRARELAEKIEDPETRKGIASFVDYFFIRALIQKKQANEAATLVQKASLNPTWRAHYLTQIASLMLKVDRIRAREMFEEALRETGRIDPSTPERAYSLIALLRQFATLDRTRSWEILSETIKAANTVPDFTGEQGQTSVTLEGKFGIRLGTQLASPTDLSEAFEALAAESFYQTLDVSKTFTGDGPRALATIAVARAVLDDKRQKR
jgi:hypothetical protein